MPWLSRKNSAEEGAKAGNDSAAPSPKRSVESTVSFIPAQMDGLCGTMPAHHKQASLQILLGDLRVLTENMSCLSAMARAICAPRVVRNLFGSLADARDTVLQLCLALTQMWMLAFALPVFLLLPGSAFVAFMGAGWVVALASTWALSGSRLVVTDRQKAPLTNEFSDERWIYVNGMMCSNRSLRSQCDRLSTVFGRAITGVHNRTSGFVPDLLVVLLQRSFGIPTPCTLALASQIRDACLTNSVRKVILLGHSTGALHVSIALDQLHAGLPFDVLSKLEIFTFGSAAAHLSNPCLRIDNPYGANITGGGAECLNHARADGGVASPIKTTFAPLPHRVEDNERVIPHSEHYALASDIFARYGVLHNTSNVLDNRFCGRVFVIDDRKPNTGRANGAGQATGGGGGGGFLMNEHYLDILFPSDVTRKTVDVLDQVVKVDIETAEKREFTALGVGPPQRSIHYGHAAKHATGGEASADVSPKTKAWLGNGDRAEKRVSCEVGGMGVVGGVGKARLAAKECEGKTVKQLSRLWRYVNGGRPGGEGVAVVNGVGRKTVGNGMGMVQ